LCKKAIVSLAIATFSLVGVVLGLNLAALYPTLLCLFTFIVGLVSFVHLACIITRMEEEHPEVLDLYPPYD
jgi:hypothetical protein